MSADGGASAGGSSIGGGGMGGDSSGGNLAGGQAGTETGGSSAGGDNGAGGDSGGAPPDCSGCACGYEPFSTPEVFTGLDLGLSLYAPSLSSDGLVLYLAAGNEENIYTATRVDRGTAFSNVVLVDELNSTDRDGAAFVTSDDLSVYFYSERPGTMGDRDLMVAVRPDPASPFGAPSFVANVNSVETDHLPFLPADQLSLYFASTRSPGTGSDLWMSTRAQIGDEFTTPVELSALNTIDRESSPAIDPSGLNLYFVSNRPGSESDDIWVATRADLNSEFDSPNLVVEVNSSASDIDLFLSLDGRELLMSSARGGSREIWRALRDCRTQPE